MKKMYVVMLAGMLACASLFAGCGSGGSEDVQSTNVDNSNDNDAQSSNDGDDNLFIEDIANVSGDDSSNDNSSSSSSLLDDISNALQADGRDYGETHELTQDDVMHSIFFDLKVNSVQTAIDYEDWTLEETGYIFLIVNVSITNTFDQDDPMSYADFPVLWGTDDGCYPDYEFESALAEQYTIKVGETVTGDLIYEVPEDIDSVTLEYYDLWSDDFEGDTFDMVIRVN